MYNIETDPRTFLARNFDVIVVGGGTAGLAVASRLSENANLSIGVLEAGIDKSSTDPVLTSGGGWLKTSSDPQYGWGFISSKQQNLVEPNNPSEKGRNLNLPRGKLLGGSSSINAMIWMRASKAEYDALETTFQNEGWNFNSLKEYFRKSQTHTVQPSETFPDSKVLPNIHGTDGPVKTSQNWWYSTLVEPHVQTIQSLPFPFNINSNPDDGNPLGLINAARSIDPKTSKRQGAISTYLKSTEGRNNIVVLVGAHVRQIIFAEGSGDIVATGVEFEVGGTQYIAEANREVILSAGAYQTPQLLELSGIGKKSILDSHDIKQRLELPVGENMQDHLLVSLSYKLKDESLLTTAQPGQEKPVLPHGFGVHCVGTDNEQNDPNRSAASSVTGGPFLVSDLNSFSANGPQDKDEKLSELLKQLTSAASSPLTKAQYELQQSWVKNSEQKYNVADALLIFACLPGMAAIPDPAGGMNFWLPLVHFHPTSRGSVHINSKDPLAKPTIDLQCMNDYDLRAFLRLVKFGDYLVRQEPLASLIVQEPQRTDAEFEDLIRKTARVTYHPVGTTPMASRELGGVVDNELKVYGTTNLRVVDASILPLQIGAMPQSTIYAIAEKAADIVKKALK